MLSEAQRVIERLIAEIKVSFARGAEDKFHTLCDELAVFTAAQLPAPAETIWEGFNLTPSERLIANLLRARLGKTVTKNAIFDALYFDDIDGGPDLKIVDIFICKMRKKLAAGNSPYRIETVWAMGWRMMDREGAKLTLIGAHGNKIERESIASHIAA